jgi:hypothetical protein
MPAEKASTTSTADALAILTIPPLDDITERQVRGIDCIWDAVPLTPATAVDLGARKASRAGAPVSWYPRGCRPCVTVAALTQIVTHVPECETCLRGEAESCDPRKALARLVEEYQR